MNITYAKKKKNHGADFSNHNQRQCIVFSCYIDVLSPFACILCIMLFVLKLCLGRPRADLLVNKCLLLSSDVSVYSTCLLAWWQRWDYP